MIGWLLNRSRDAAPGNCWLTGEGNLDLMRFRKVVVNTRARRWGWCEAGAGLCSGAHASIVVLTAHFGD